MSEPMTSSREVPRRGRQAWIERLDRFKDSGQSPAAFCAAEGVSLPSFYSWRRRLSAQTSDAAPTGAKQSSTPRLLPVLLQGQFALVEVVLLSGLVLRLPRDCDL